MPEAKIGGLLYPTEPPKRPPIIKVSCGIGDTDGFPAFDVDSDNYAAPDDPKWGFRITGGAEFHMPITVFQVTDGGLADQGGIRLGDIIVEINETDVTNLPLAKVQEIIDSSAKKIYIVARGMEDDEMNAEPQEEEKTIVLRVPKPLPPPKASIEERLREMQRKLSEIAEIPKILSSTLQTVSQTFEKFLPPEEGTRRQSQAYESDLDSVTDENADVLSEPDSLEILNKYKDRTPESDYVSESNDDETEQMDENECESDEEQQYTWNLSNIPEVNIEETEEDTDEEPEEEKEPTAEDICRQEKQEKIEKLDRAWPWADREKIIYRQSTCHLVPRQPLGIVEDRIKLLAKRNIAGIYERRQSEI